MKAKLKTDCINSANAIVESFAKKQGFTDWYLIGGGDPSGWYDFNGAYTFSFSDIWEDMTNRQAKRGRIIAYQDYYVEQHLKDPKAPVPNYKNWLIIGN